MFSTQQQGRQWMRPNPAPSRSFTGRQSLPTRPGMPFGGPNQGATQGGGGVQGFIKKIFGGGSNPTPGPMGPGFGPTAFGQSAGKSGISGILGNTQEILKIAKTAAPYIKEYGPMVKNLPAMIQMVKALNSDDSEETDASDESEDVDGDVEEEEDSIDLEDELDFEDEIPVKKDKKPRSKSSNMATKKKSKPVVETSSDELNGISKPKLFI
ncbi:VrrA/YqfQ family protein [Radiobacillus deserti]|nr:VrrA/YqfQ family protein [Radiobacillus deserti]